MPIIHFSRPTTKARRRGNGPLKPEALEALQDRMSNAFSLDFSRGVTRLKDSITSAQMEKAVRSGNYKAVTETTAWGKLGDHLSDAVGRLGDTADGAGRMAEKALPPVVKDNLKYDTRNPKLDDYLQTRTGALVENVTDEMQANVQIATRMAFEDGATQRQVADTIKGQLRDSIGLNSRQAQALANYQGDDKDAYAERLLDQRAMMIARTEVSYATNHGQLSVWKAAADQGLIDEGSQKVWVVDGLPCPFICEPMDGVAVGLDEPFTLPDGAEVDGPPAHPNCYCAVSIDLKVSDGARQEEADEPEEND